MSKTKSKYSTCEVRKEGISKRTGKKFSRVVGYLSNRDEQKGLDIHYDMIGYKVIAL